MSAEGEKHIYYINTRGAVYKIGDQFWQMNHAQRKKISPKLQATWLRPWVETEKVNAVPTKTLWQQGCSRVAFPDRE